MKLTYGFFTAGKFASLTNSCCAGAPIINTDRFPDMAAMTAHGHAKGIRVGWYMNNCICGEHQFSGDMIASVMEASAKAVALYGYDGMCNALFVTHHSHLYCSTSEAAIRAAQNLQLAV